MRSKRQRLLLRWGGLAAVAAATVAGVVAVVDRPIDPAAPAKDGTVAGLTSVLSREVTAAMVGFRFEEVAAEAGIDFRHFPARRASLLPEDMGSGAAWGDYDGDGDPDLFLVNFAGSILDSDGGEDSGSSALYRNDGSGRFTDVSHAAGLDAPGFGMGACWGDYDDDGDLDLYVTHFGANRLYRNEGDTTFTEVAVAAGVADDRFGAGCAWSDYDGDGHIDLYVTNYVEFAYRPEDRERAARQYGSLIPYTLNPSSYPPAPNRLYRNRGDGTFAEVAEEAGVADPEGRSLAAAWFDFDDDGFTDLYVANDVSANGVFRNQGDGTFADIGASSLAADYRGAMGLAVADYDRDGDQDLLVTHWVAQENAFFENMASAGLRDALGDRRLFFMDQAEVRGLGQISLQMVGWATGFADFDNDGHLDLWIVNGSTLEDEADRSRLRPQPVQLFRQRPPDGFFEMGRQACAAVAEPVVGRGGAQADYDGDGRMDLVVAVHGGRPWLLHNTSTTAGHWLGVRLRQTGGNTHALGARVEVHAGGAVQTAQVGSGGSYLSQNDTDLHFGLGEAVTIDELVIRWPDGATERHGLVEADRLLVLDHKAHYGVR